MSAQRSTSVLMKAAKLSGVEEASGSSAIVVSFSRVAGSAISFAICAANGSTIARDTPAGATTPLPRHQFEAGQPRLGERRDIRCDRNPPGRGHAKHPHLAFADLRQGRLQVHHHEWNVSRDHIEHRRHTAAVRHMTDI